MLDVYIQRGMPRKNLVTFHVKTDNIISETDAHAIQSWHGLPPCHAEFFRFRLVGRKLLNREDTTDDRVLREYEWECIDTLGSTTDGDL